MKLGQNVFKIYSYIICIQTILQYEGHSRTSSNAIRECLCFSFMSEHLFCSLHTQCISLRSLCEIVAFLHQRSDRILSSIKSKPEFLLLR